MYLPRSVTVRGLAPTVIFIPNQPTKSFRAAPGVVPVTNAVVVPPMLTKGKTKARAKIKMLGDKIEVFVLMNLKLFFEIKLIMISSQQVAFCVIQTRNCYWPASADRKGPRFQGRP